MPASFLSRLAAARKTTAVSEMAPNDTSDHSDTPSQHSKAPQMYDQSALEITVTPPQTSYTQSPDSPQAQLEMKYTRKAKRLSITRLALAILFTFLGAAVIGCTAQILSYYHATTFTDETSLPLWPADIDSHPTYGLMVPAILGVLMSLFYILLAALPFFRSKPVFLNTMFVLVSLGNVTGSFAAVLFYALKTYWIDPKIDEQITIEAFTCDLYHGAVAFITDPTNSNLTYYDTLQPPMGFKQVCIESQAAFGLSVTVIPVALAALIVAGVSYWADRKAKKEQASRDEKWFDNL